MTISFLLSLSACSQNVVIKKEPIAVLPPDNLLISPCNQHGAGTTVRSLAEGYLENVSCIRKHKTRLESLTKWKKEQEDIYNAK